MGKQTLSTNDLEAALCGNDCNQLLEAKIVPPTVWEHLRKDLSLTVVIFSVNSSLSNRSKSEQIYSYIQTYQGLKTSKFPLTSI